LTNPGPMIDGYDIRVVLWEFVVGVADDFVDCGGSTSSVNVKIDALMEDLDEEY
jgi:hypothetical protein